MPWIQQIPVDEATGFLKTLFEAALRRAGRVWNVVHIQSLRHLMAHPRALEANIGLYLALLYAPSPLSRSQREMLAVVTSWENGCRY